MEAQRLAEIREFHKNLQSLRAQVSDKGLLDRCDEYLRELLGEMPPPEPVAPPEPPPPSMPPPPSIEPPPGEPGHEPSAG